MRAAVSNLKVLEDSLHGPEKTMDAYGWIWITILAADYGLPLIIGLCASTWRKAILLTIASFAGLYVSICSTLGPLFLPLPVELVTRFELFGILILSFAVGAAQAALIATVGFMSKRLFIWSLRISGRPAA